MTATRERASAGGMLRARAVCRATVCLVAVTCALGVSSTARALPGASPLASVRAGTEGADALSPPVPPGATPPDTSDTSDGVSFDLAAGTHFPVSVGAEATLELPGRLLVQMHVGWMPDGYLRLVNDVATGVGWYDGATARAIEASLQGTLWVRPALGWRPFPDAGFELWLGYTYGTASNRPTRSELVGAGVPAGDQRVPVSGRVHAIDALLGWRFVPSDHLVIRTGIGYTKVLGADVDVGERTTDYYREASDLVEDTITDYVQTVELRLTLGFRL